MFPSGRAFGFPRPPRPPPSPTVEPCQSPPFQDCWDGNVCQLDNQCGKNGRCKILMHDSCRPTGYVHQPIQDFFKTFLYQGGMKSTVSWVFEDLKFKISEGYDQNWCFPDSAQLAVSAELRQLTGQTQENTNLGPNLLKF